MSEDIIKRIFQIDFCVNGMTVAAGTEMVSCFMETYSPPVLSRRISAA